MFGIKIQITFTLSLTQNKILMPAQNSHQATTDKIKTMLIDINQHHSEIVDEVNISEPLNITFNGQTISLNLNSEATIDTVQNFFNELVMDNTLAEGN